MRRFTTTSLIAIGTLFLMFAGCASTGSSNTKSVEYENKVSGGQDLTLEDYLRRLSGVRVTGSGENISVTIRSNMSISDANKQPLFVINGQQAGRSYSQANQMISRGTITSVEAIPPSRASQYGMQGSAGVIEIETE
ncbi:MAG: TonB-dependent receptor plug domain-containing protein [Fodinibius sp.]|nr:TonB-dependent receptor plug domain-containing protein [Fodinibius sp.]